MDSVSCLRSPSPRHFGRPGLGQAEAARGRTSSDVNSAAVGGAVGVGPGPAWRARGGWHGASSAAPGAPPATRAPGCRWGRGRSRTAAGTRRRRSNRRGPWLPGEMRMRAASDRRYCPMAGDARIAAAVTACPSWSRAQPQAVLPAASACHRCRGRG